MPYFDITAYDNFIAMVILKIDFLLLLTTKAVLHKHTHTHTHTHTYTHTHMHTHTHMLRHTHTHTDTNTYFITIRPLFLTPQATVPYSNGHPPLKPEEKTKHR